MKSFLLTITVLILSLPSVGHALEKGITLLNDRQMAGVRGGICAFHECEGPPGTGACQPYKIDEETLCNLVVCLFGEEWVGNVLVVECVGEAPDTCTETATYRQCIQVFSWSFCKNGPDTTYCGKHVSPDCTPSGKRVACLCYVKAPDRVCDWTNCVDDN